MKGIATGRGVRCVGMALLVTWAGGCGLLYPDRWDERLEVLEMFRAAWESQGIRSYVFVHTERSAHPRDAAGPVLVTVEDGTIAAVEPLTVTGTEPEAEWYRTVDGLFDLVANAIARKPGHFEVAYDAALGYPSFISVDYGRADESFTIFIDEFDLYEPPDA